MGIYEPDHQIGMWEDSFKTDSCQNICTSPAAETDMRLVYMLEHIPHKELTQPKDYDQETNKSSDKVLRRLAQNREAARKSRLRKKAYVQQLESSRSKLCQLEQELEQVRQKGIYIGGRLGERTLGLSGSVNSGIAVFEMEYGHWVEKQNQQTCQLRAALQAHASDIDLHMLVESGIRHYDNLFRIKAITAKSDVFYLMSGMWRTPTERFFLWIGGFRPSKLLKVLSSQLNPLTEQQMRAVTGLQQCSQQAEDALSQGLEKLKQTLSETLACDPFGTFGVTNYMGQMAIAMTKLEALVSFVNQIPIERTQKSGYREDCWMVVGSVKFFSEVLKGHQKADHLRQQALWQMYNILTTRQSARGLLALGDYFQCLRALSSQWATRPPS